MSEKNCPLCNFEPRVYDNGVAEWAVCTNSDCPLSKEPMLFYLWQSRPLEDALQARITELEKQLQSYKDFCSAIEREE